MQADFGYSVQVYLQPVGLHRYNVNEFFLAFIWNHINLLVMKYFTDC